MRRQAIVLPRHNCSQARIDSGKQAKIGVAEVKSQAFQVQHL